MRVQGIASLSGVDVIRVSLSILEPHEGMNLATSRHWPVHQLDVKNAFLHGLSRHPELGFNGDDTAYLLLYVDDIVIIAFSKTLLQQVIRSLHQEFAMTDLGSLNYFLSISVTRDFSGMFLSQKKYVVEILDRAHMVNCNPSWTPIDTESKLGSDGDPVSDPTLYQSLATSLQYLTFTRPDISYAVQQEVNRHEVPRMHWIMFWIALLKIYVHHVLGNLFSSMSDSEDSTVTYTEISSPYEDLSDVGSPGAEGPIFQDPPSPDYVPGPEEPEQAPPSPIYIPFVPEPVYPEFLPVDDEVFPAEEQPMPAADSPTHQSPGYIPESDPEEDPEEDDEEDPEEDPADYPADRGDDRDDEEPSDDDDDDAEEEEHLAPADPAAVAYSADQDPYLAYRVTARMSIRPQAPAPFLSEEVAERLLALPTPPPSPLSPYSSPLPQIPSPPLPIPSPPPNGPTYVEGSLGS
ncbi:ribonuclease H-like domain-containing protein [Tanacetum coccineum]